MDDEPQAKKKKTSPPTSFLLTSSLCPLTYDSPSLHAISTGYIALDQALRGGLPCGGLAEIFGTSGSGKTTLALSLLASAVSTGGSALLLDCDGSFHAGRFLQLASSHGCDKNAALSRLYVARCTSWDALASGVAHTLPTVLHQRDVRLVVVDSVAFLFRTAEGTAVSKRLEALAMRLQAAAAECGTSVVLVNHAKSMRQADTVFPAMGEGWQHVCATRLCMAWDERRNRFVEIVKSPVAKQARVVFEIGEKGLVEPDED